MLTGTELITSIETCQLDYGQCCLWWLGQHSFIVKLGKTTCFFDLFLTPSAERNVQPFLKPHEINNADFIFGSHDHADHIDRPIWPLLAKSSPNSIFIVPEAIREQLCDDLKISPKRVVGLDDALSFEKDGIKITAVAAAHEFLDCDKVGHNMYLGYCIEGNGCKVYHAGDTCNYEGLQTSLKQINPHIMLLPINGRDAKRFASGCIGNMTYQEAADLAGVCKPCLVIPTHYDMFVANTEDPMLFADYMNVKYPNLNVHICQYAERVIVSLSDSKVCRDERFTLCDNLSRKRNCHIS